MSTTMSCFRLFDLPLDLLELLTLYFEGKEAVKLLTVSSNFHEVFARSVWHTITHRTIDVAEPIRSSAYARYGHLVRSIDLLSEFYYSFDSHNWAQLFPNTTSMTFDISSEMKNSDKQTFMDAIANLHGLRSLKINIGNTRPPFDLEALAKTLVTRHGDPSKQSLRELTMFFDIEDENNVEKISWIDLSSFVQILSPLRSSIRLQIDLSGFPDLAAPAPAQMDILRPHLIGIPDFTETDNEDGCKALRNRQLFSPSGTYDDPLVFSQLHDLYISVCCASSLLFDYSDFTPAKFPVMRSIKITEDMCSRQAEEGAATAIQTLLLQKWPELKELGVYGSGLTFSTVDELIELNPQLTSLDIGIRHNTNDTDNVFMFERVAGRLPHLTLLTLRSESSIMVDSDWLQAASLVDIRSSKLTSISISETMVSHRLFETLLTLPSLHGLGLWYCVLAEPELVMSVFKRHRQTAREDATVDIRRFAISTPGVDNNWSTELMLEMIASFTRLESCRIYSNDALRNAIQEKHPELF